MPILSFKDRKPTIAPSAFIAPDCWITGEVSVAENAGIFFGACVRGDLEPIQIGEGSNIQELSVLHTSQGKDPCIVGPGVTVGHRAILHSCCVRGHSIIGMGAVVLDGADVGEYTIIGAQSLIPMNMKIPPRSMVYGSPAKVIRELSSAEIIQIEDTASRYIEVGKEYRRVLLDVKKG
jgi:carbonic anhydrase/acetyltransferase-like protein (isoleucine patch superfamily)